jgi:predicted nucleic acid-binding protein
VLALGLQLPGAILMMDERLARLHAEAKKLLFTGTLGILLRAKQEGRISQLAPVLAHLEHLKFRVSPRTRAAILNLAGEVQE